MKMEKRVCWFCLLGSIISSQSAMADSKRIEQTGDLLQIIIPAIAYGTTFYLDDKTGRQQFYKSLISTVAVTHGLKVMTNKTRPNGSSKSFPSGHTSAAFQGAAFIHKRYGFEYAVPAYLGATFVGYSRVKSNHHHLEDVIAGAAIGVISNLYFTTSYKGFVINPYRDHGRYRIGITKNF